MNELDLRPRYCVELEICNDAWPDRHKVRKEFKLSNTLENLKFLMFHLGIDVKYNVISKDIEIETPNKLYDAFDDGKNSAMNAIVSECCRYQLPKSNTKDYLDTIGYQNRFNPVIDWIKSKPYAGEDDYIDMMCQTVTARDDFDPLFKDLLIKKWLISCVAMAANDRAEYWSKGCLVFQGDQNVGKTYWYWALLPGRQLSGWGKESVLLRPENKDSVVTACGNWIAELGELDSTFKKSDISQLKGFLTQSSDKLRRPFGRKDSIYPRRTAFFGSVNPREFLKDETGNSRFWVIPVVDVNYLHGIDLQQMWAQAYDVFLNNGNIDPANWFLSHDEFIQLEKYNEYSRELSPIEEKIVSRLIWTNQYMTASQVLDSIGYDKPTKSDRNTAANSLRRYFGESKPSREGRVFDMWVKDGQQITV